MFNCKNLPECYIVSTEVNRSVPQAWPARKWMLFGDGENLTIRGQTKASETPLKLYPPRRCLEGKVKGRLRSRRHVPVCDIDVHLKRFDMNARTLQNYLTLQDKEPI